MRPKLAFQSLATRALLAMLCVVLAAGNISRARQVMAGSFGAGSNCLLGTAPSPGSRLPSQEELPTEAPSSSELSETSESASLAEGRRILRRSYGIGPYVSRAARANLAFTAMRRGTGNAIFETAFRNGLGAPIRC